MEMIDLLDLNDHRCIWMITFATTFNIMTPLLHPHFHWALQVLLTILSIILLALIFRIAIEPFLLLLPE